MGCVSSKAAVASKPLAGITSPSGELSGAPLQKAELPAQPCEESERRIETSVISLSAVQNESKVKKRSLEKALQVMDGEVKSRVHGVVT